MNRLLLLALVLMLLGTATASGRKRVTTRPKLKRIEAVDSTVVSDTLAAAQLDSIIIAGYDKPLRSMRESLFVRNATDHDLTSVTLSVDYLDMQGRQLHHADITLPVDIPAGETRQVSFASWDRQMTFVYYRSERSRNSRAVAYRIAASVTAALASAPKLGYTVR